nr:retrovirus-related Pol polyprotein from transposon TNT 1-94 [Tanacetum cinerariifolium]
MAQTTARNHVQRGNHKQYAGMTLLNPQRHVVPNPTLTLSKLVLITSVRPVTTAVPKPTVTRLRQATTIVTKPNSPPKRHITCSPSPKANTFPPKVIDVKAPMVNATKGVQGKWEWKPKYPILDHDKGVIDSGCLRYMTGNMSYLSDFKELNGRYVAFGGNPKGGKISGKGKIRTGKLDFNDVYFVKELKFNLFSVSQMCDKKNSVLFIDTECLVLSLEFKLSDENKVLLRVPRENNMYNVNLKNIVLSGDLTCLFAKATLNESNLWYRRLGHINFKTMNKLVKGNLVRGLPSKVFENDHTCVACKKGKQHRASCRFDGKVDGGFLVGYSVSSKAFRVFNSRTQIVQETLRIHFLENMPNVADAAFDEKEPEFEGRKPESEVNVFPSSSAQSKKHDDKTKREAKGKNPIESLTGYRNLSAKFEDFSDNSINDDNDAVSPIPTTRVYKDHLVTQIIGDLSSATQTRSMTRVAKDQGGLSQINNNDFHTCMFSYFLSQEQPKRVHQALKYPSWIEAIQKELLQFKMQKVWVLVDSPHGKRAIEEGIDYEEVFAPVARIEAIRLFLAYASFMGFMVYQMDVKSDFLYGTIKEKVYVCQPLRFEDPDYPAKRGKIDQTLFIKKKKGVTLLVHIYVDDIIFGSTNKDLCKDFEMLMKDKFQISSMGELTFFLGLQVKQKKDGMFISQNKHVAEILRKFGLTDKKSASTPIDTKKPLLKDPDVKKANDVSRLQPVVDRKKVIITEATIRDALRLDDAEGIECLPNEEIFTELARMGVEKGCSGVETPLFKGMIVAQQVGEGAAKVNVKDVSTAGVAAEGAASATDDEVPVADAGISMDLLQNLLDTCTTLTRRVKNLEQDKIAQALEITKLKQRVKKLERKNKASKLKRLKKVGTKQRIETSNDTVMDDVSKQGRIIADKDVTLKDVAAVAKDVQDAEIEESLDVQGRQAESQAQIYQIDLEHADKVLSMQDVDIEPAELQEVVEVVTTAKLITEVVTAVSATITAAAPQFTTAAAPTLTTAPSTARRRKGVVIRDPEETATPSTIIHTESKSKDKGNGILEKEDNAVKRYQALKRKPQTEAQARKNMMIYLRNVAEFKMDYFKGMTYDDIPRKQKLEEEVEELRKHLMIVPNKDDDVYTEATPVALKVPVVDYEIYTENNKPYYKIKRADERFASTKPKNFSDDFLLTILGAMFEKLDIQAQIWKNQRSVHERKYPLTRFTLDQMLNNVRLKVEEESEVSLKLLRFIKQQHQEDENSICTVRNYSSPSHEGYRNTIELPDGNNVVPLRSDTIRTTILYNDILIFQQHQGESLSKAWTRFKNLLQKVPRHGIDLWLHAQIFYDHIDQTLKRTMDYAAEGRLKKMSAEKPGPPSRN